MERGRGGASAFFFFLDGLALPLPLDDFFAAGFLLFFELALLRLPVLHTLKLGARAHTHARAGAQLRVHTHAQLAASCGLGPMGQRKWTFSSSSQPGASLSFWTVSSRPRRRSCSRQTNTCPLEESRRRCGSGEPSPGADAAKASPVPVQMWQG